MVQRHHVRAATPGIHVFGGRHGLAQSPRALVALVEQLDATFCLEALEDALSEHRPDIFNTDQGRQFEVDPGNWTAG